MEEKLLDAYFAGLIDGEGNVAVYPYKAGTLRRPSIKVSMTCERTVRAIQEHFGGYVGPKKVRVGDKPQWLWQVTFNKAKIVAARIRPYLITKAAGADAIIAFEARSAGRISRPKT